MEYCEEVLTETDMGFCLGRREKGRSPRHGAATEFAVRSAFEGNQTGLRSSVPTAQVKSAALTDA